MTTVTDTMIDEAKRLALPRMVEVSLTISFDDLLGASPDVMTVHERKSRWSEWLAIADRDAKECADAWRDVSACCEGGVCRHLDGGWCKLMELPATVNPYLSRRTGTPGMACMGAAHEVPGQQLEMFNDFVTGDGCREIGGGA